MVSRVQNCSADKIYPEREFFYFWTSVHVSTARRAADTCVCFIIYKSKSCIYRRVRRSLRISKRMVFFSILFYLNFFRSTLFRRRSGLEGRDPRRPHRRRGEAASGLEGKRTMRRAVDASSAAHIS